MKTGESSRMKCVEKEGGGRWPTRYSQRAGGRGSALPLAEELCLDLGERKCESLTAAVIDTKIDAQICTHKYIIVCACGFFYRLKGLIEMREQCCSLSDAWLCE